MKTIVCAFLFAPAVCCGMTTTESLLQKTVTEQEEERERALQFIASFEAAIGGEPLFRSRSCEYSGQKKIKQRQSKWKRLLSKIKSALEL